MTVRIIDIIPIRLQATKKTKQTKKLAIKRGELLRKTPVMCTVIGVPACSVSSLPHIGQLGASLLPHPVVLKISRVSRAKARRGLALLYSLELV